MEKKDKLIDESVQNEALNLYRIVKKLRSPTGCPWDKKLKIENCTEYILEETYEVIETIDKKDTEGLLEELGDILSQVFMISQIASENNLFNICDVFSKISQKLLFRHPHVFGKEKAETADEVLKIWNIQKLKEKKERKNFIEGIPKALPPSYILIKLFRKLKQYPKIFDIVSQQIMSKKSSIKNSFEHFIEYLDLLIEKESKDDIKENQKDSFQRNEFDSSSNCEVQQFLSDIFLLLYYYTFLAGIDPERFLREKIDNILKIFEENNK